MRRLLVTLPLALPFLQPAASLYDSLSADAKFDLIEQGRVPAGKEVLFRERELNDYLARKAQQVVPQGLRAPRVELRQNRITGYALVDFVKLRHAQGRDLGWLTRTLLEGEHAVKVTGKLQSRNGIAQLDLERVEVDGHSVSGRTLDLMIHTFVVPLYPEAKVGQSFELGYNVDRIELWPGLARVVMAAKPAQPEGR